MERYFAFLDENNKVINTAKVLNDENPELTFAHFPNLTPIEYSLDKSITNTKAEIAYIFNKDLNCFLPEKPDDSYILNLNNYLWEPDPNLEYELHKNVGDYTLYKWNGEGWYRAN